MTAKGMRIRGRGGPGTGQWIGLCLAGVVILGLTFTLGLLVGRQWARPAPPSAASQIETPPIPARRGGLVSAPAERAPQARQVQDKLTFYHTLTAPLAGTPVPSKTKQEEKVKQAGPRSDEPPRGPEAQQDAAREASSSWSVQVAAFKSRSQADGVQKQLAEAGFNAYVTAVSTHDGQMRYRVRVGSFRTREEALRVADRVRSERALPTLVTPN